MPGMNAGPNTACGGNARGTGVVHGALMQNNEGVALGCRILDSQAVAPAPVSWGDRQGKGLVIEHGRSVLQGLPDVLVLEFGILPAELSPRPRRRGAPSTASRVCTAVRSAARDRRLFGQ